MKRSLSFVLTGILSMVAVSSVWAAPNNFEYKGDQSGPQLSRTLEMLERARVARQIEEDREREQAKLQGEEVKQVEQEQSKVKFALTKVDYNQSQVLPQEKIQSLVDNYVGKNVTIGDLYQIVGEINKLYAEGGYVTCKAFLPPQKVEKGVVKVLLVEGKTGKVTVDAKNTKSGYITRRVNLPSGEVVQIKDLNDRLMLFNGTNDAQLRITMQAGQAPGTTDFVISAYEPQRFSSTLFTDNAGNYTSGAYRTGYFLTARSLSGVRDNLTIGTICSEGTKAYSGVYNFPIGPSGTQVGLAFSGNSVKIVRGETEDLHVKGHSTAYTVSLRQPWIVNSTTRSEIGFEVNNQNSKTDVSGYHWVDDLARDFVPYFSHTSYGKSHVFYQKYAYAAIGNSKDITDADRDYHYHKYTAYYQKGYHHGQLWTARLDAQLEGTNELPSSRQFYIGGLNSVRGYKESLLSGDRGFAASLEYSLPLDTERKWNAYGFYDYGSVGGDSAFENHVLHSVGFGVKVNISKHIFSSLCLAFPLITDINETEVGKTRIHYMLSWQF